MEKVVRFDAKHPMFKFEVAKVDSQIIELLRTAEPVVVVGMGGSVLPLKAFLDFFSLQEKVHVLDTVDPIAFEKVKNFKNPLFCVVSKSGETLEIKALLNEILSRGFEKRILAVTDPDKGHLRKLSVEKKWPTLNIPSDIGGRFTSFSVFHRAVLEAFQVNFEAMLNSAKKVRDELKKDVSILNGFFEQIFENGLPRNALILWMYGERVHGLGLWLQQALAESLGKRTASGDRVGFLPVVLKGPQDQHSVLQLLIDGPQDKVLWFFSALSKSIDKKSLGGALKILLDSTYKTFEERLQDQDTAQPIYRFNLETTEDFVRTIVTMQAFIEYAAERLQINAFDQPGVERGKEIARELLNQ